MTNQDRHDLAVPPPSIDEGYWAALLNEGEHNDISHDSRTYGDVDAIPPHDDHYEPAYEALTPANEDDWDEIWRINAMDETLELTVISYNRGGLLVEWRSLHGFVPASQLIDFSANGPPDNGRRRALINRIGEKLTLRVIELNREKNRLILSERAAQARPGERAYILQSLQKGDIVTGHITNLCDFGAFVDLGGLEGLIHISELSWGRVGHPEHVLHRGQQVKAYVLDVDENQARIALSLKRLRPDPWRTVETRYEIGEIVEGRITNVVDFGAFACIEEGLEGLIHVSELAEGHFLHPRNVVAEGQTVRARILNIDGSARRLGLSLRLAD